MTITTYEGIVEKGKIRLRHDIRLPDNTRIYVVVPDLQTKETSRIMTPRLVHRKQVSDFKMEISEDNSNASLRR